MIVVSKTCDEKILAQVSELYEFLVSTQFMLSGKVVFLCSNNATNIFLEETSVKKFVLHSIHENKGYLQHKHSVQSNDNGLLKMVAGVNVLVFASV